MRPIHLIGEADDERALARGMQGLGVRIAKALNRLMGRKGTGFAYHYHARQLRSPTQVANALAYVLMNFLHHFPEEARRFPADGSRSLQLRVARAGDRSSRGGGTHVVARRRLAMECGTRVAANRR